MNNVAAVAACLVQVGTQGCNYEQQLSAAADGLNTDNFVRPDSITLILVVSDEEDCSIGSEEWYQLDELSNAEANLACGRHQDLLKDINDIRETMIASKVAAGGTGDRVMFAGIIGVPPVAACQGSGTQISECLNVSPGINGAGTVGDPDEVQRMVAPDVYQVYYEYACERYEGDEAVTKAYPGARFVKLAQSFGEMGYIYSICNEDWTPVMTNVANTLLEKASTPLCR